MASPFYPISSTRPSLTPPTIGGFSSSPPAGTPLTHAFSQQPLNNQQHTSMLAPSASIGSSGSLLMPSMLRPTMPPQATEIPETTSAGSFAPAVSAPAAAPSTPASSAVDETQVMTKLQQLMNQMGTFMKSVDARLTTLEKMTGQLMSSHTEQAKSMELRFQEIAQLIQQKSSIIQLQPQGGSHPTQAQPHSSFSGVPAVPVSHQSFSAPAQAVPGGAAASADYELARQLQEQFDRESHQQVPRPGQPLYAPMGSAPMGTAPIVPGMGVPTQPNLAALQMQQFQQQQQQQQRQAMPPAGKVDPKQLSTCPICSVQKPLADMEEHVNQHFDESEGVVVEALDQSKAKQQNRGFWDRLFGAEDEPQPPAPGPPAGQTGAGAFPPGGQMLMYPTGGMHPGAAGQPMYGYAAYPQPQQYSYRR